MVSRPVAAFCPHAWQYAPCNGALQFLQVWSCGGVEVFIVRSKITPAKVQINYRFCGSLKETFDKKFNCRIEKIF
jgi:hypothetical protein